MTRRALPENLDICLIHRNFPIPGRSSTTRAESGFLWPIARGLAQKGHRVTVFSAENPTHEPRLEIDNVQFFFLNESHPLSQLSKFPRLAQKMFSDLHRKKPFHIVHSFDDSAKWIARYKKQYRTNAAFDVEATQLSQLFAIMAMSQETLGSLLRTAVAVAYKFLTTYFSQDRTLLKNADGIFVTSPQQRWALERYYIYPDAKMHTIPYGIEIQEMVSRERVLELRKTHDIPADAKVILTVSDMTELEETRNLLYAFRDVALKNSQARLILIGAGPKRKEIEFEMLNLVLGSRVIMPGALRVEEISEWISLCDVYVNLSARSTGFERGMLEAMSRRKIILGSELNSVASLIEDQKDGFLVRPADISAIAHLLIEIFQGRLPTDDIGDRARRKIADLFDIQKMVDETITSYFKILRSTRVY